MNMDTESLDNASSNSINIKLNEYNTPILQSGNINAVTNDDNETNQDDHFKTTNPNNERNNNDQNNKKKRPRENHRPLAKDRMCNSVEKGIECPHLETCTYCHDPLEYLKSKPADIGPICNIYNDFGYCPNGITCRFGDSHIDKITGKNKIRPVDEGGVIEKVSINVLSKHLQILFRKKKYNYNNASLNKADNVNEKSNAQVTSITNVDNNKTDTITTFENKKFEIHDGKDTVILTNTSSSSSATTIATTTNNNNNNNNSTTTSQSGMSSIKHEKFQNSLKGYDSYVKLVDFSNKVYVAPLTTVGNLPFRRSVRRYYN